MQSWEDTLGPGVESRFRIDPEQQTVELFEIRPCFMDTSRKRGSNQIRLNLHHQLYWDRTSSGS